VSDSWPAIVDHLVYAAPDLDCGIDEIERLTGVVATPGGRHPGRGTRNALVALGGDTYLEIIAPDPEQPPPTAPRWLGVDAVTTPRLTTWAVKGTNLDQLRTRARDEGVMLGEVRAGERERADGVTLSWQLTDPEPLIADGVIPFFIDWGTSPHPARSAVGGVRLKEIRLEHPDIAEVRRMLRALDLDVPTVGAEYPAVVAVVEGRYGLVELRGVARNDGGN